MGGCLIKSKSFVLNIIPKYISEGQGLYRKLNFGKNTIFFENEFISIFLLKDWETDKDAQNCLEPHKNENYLRQKFRFCLFNLQKRC